MKHLPTIHRNGLQVIYDSGEGMVDLQMLHLNLQIQQQQQAIQHLQRKATEDQWKYAE